MAQQKKLGELLLDTGLIDDFQLSTALAHQRNWGGKLGAILAELEFVREDDVTRVIAGKLRIPYVGLFDPEIPESILKLIKPEIAKKYTVLPVRKEGGGVVVAMADPLNIEVIDELRFITGLNIRPALALESEIKLAVRKYYDHEEVARKTSTPFREIAKTSSGIMDIVRGNDRSTLRPGEKAGPREFQGNQSLRLDALINLLIEKRIITREELTGMIDQKK